MQNEASIIEEQINGVILYGILIENEDRKFRFPNISEDREEVVSLLKRISNDVSPEHYNDIIRDHIIGKAYDKLISNGLA